MINFKNKYILCSAALLCTVTFTSCNDFLDKLPDDRAELNTVEKVSNFLTSAYPKASTNMIMELSSDNVSDYGASYKTAVLLEELYKWQDVTSDGTDSPYLIWNAFYQAVAKANEALQAEIGRAHV